MSMQAPMWSMPATVVRWRDGDTVIVDAHTSPGVTVRAVVRVYGIDTPEVGQPGHDEAKAAAEAVAPVGAEDIMLSVRPVTDKYGRWLASVSNDGTFSDVARVLLRDGHAVPYYGGTKGVIPPTT